MRFYLYLALGLIGGIPAGMGMGGGTLTIPLLLFFGGVEQRVAQCANLFSFLPMSAFALRKHGQKGLLKTTGLGWIVLPALVVGGLGAVLAAYLPSATLKKGFGAFLIGLAAYELTSIFGKKKT